MEIVTNRFRLRPFRLTDDHDLVRWMNDPAIFANTLHIPSPYRIKDAKEFIAKNLRQYRQKEPLAVGYVLDIGGHAAGALGCTFRGTTGEIGYWLAKPYRGRGIMTEALVLFTDFLFTTYQLKRVEAFTFVHNQASAKLLQKTGFHSEGILLRQAEKETDEEMFVLERK